jgi:DNA-dependent RNA polymerase auxiliary subunit epsilon
MRRLAWPLFLFACASCGVPAPAPVEGDLASVLERGLRDGTDGFDHGIWDEILSKYALEGGRRFDYAGLKSEEGLLATYLDSLADVDLERLRAPELEALFINAYNAYTVRSVLDRVSEDGDFEIESIRDIEDVFTREAHVVGGFRLSLDNIEHNILRPTFRDPRLHFAVNCASISCPPLPTDAFEGVRVEEQLESSAANVLGNPDYASIEDGALLLTKILEWYGSDFVNPEYRGAEKSLPAFVSKYANEDVRRFLEERKHDVEVRFRDYDWRLNRLES